MTIRRNTVRFVLNGEIHELEDVDPTLTILDYVRNHLHRTGTKEGCREGDCGACTLVLGELVGDQINYQAINSCITFAPTLNGKELVTIEDLVGVDGNPHPVQRSMADNHASQCGFCTPGFVMSLFSHYQNDGPTDRRSINDALAGNLCRCTGYGPILTAAQKMFEYENPGHERQHQDTAQLLKSIQTTEPLEIEFTDPATQLAKRFVAPKSLIDLKAAMEKSPEAVLLAGGTDIGLWVTKQGRVLEPLIYLGEIAELKEVRETEEHITIGSMVSYTQAHNILAKHFVDFGEVIRRIGSTQIRNLGTIGGNIANGSPVGDTLPILISLDAEIILTSQTGQRIIPLESYFISYGVQDKKPGEFIEKILIPKPKVGERLLAYKISKRFDQDISAICGSFWFQIQENKITDIRIAFGGIAEIPKRADKTERALEKKELTPKTLEEALKAIEGDFAPISDMRASANYRTLVAKKLLEKAFLELTKPDEKTRVLEAGEANQ